MNDLTPLSGLALAISISESPDMPYLGLAKEHLDDAMAEVARHLLAMGARILYGGDLRAKGFTEALFEIIARHHSDADLANEQVGVTNLLAWPVHISMGSADVEQISDGLTGVAELVFLTLDGSVMPVEERQRIAPQEATAKEWAAGLTAMRNVMTAMTDARIVLGGRVEGFNGTMPGVAEEALTTLRAGKALFLLGGFGGCACDIAEDLGLAQPRAAKRSQWPRRSEFAGFVAEDLNNELAREENVLLAATVHIDQAMTLILRGLLRKMGRGAPSESA